MGRAADFEPGRYSDDNLPYVEKRPRGRSFVLLAGLQAVPVFMAGPDTYVLLLPCTIVSDAPNELVTVDNGRADGFCHSDSRFRR